MKKQTIVLGGGLSGLCAAYALSAAGEETLVLEPSDRAGGAVRTERFEGFLLEAGPNTVRGTPELWRLIEQLGLAGEVLLSDPRLPRFIDFAGRLQALPASPLALAGTSLLSLGGKLRLFAEPFQPRGPQTEESVRDFFARRLGPEIADRIVEPFVGGIFAGSASRLSIEAAFPLLARWEREHGGLLRGALRGRPRPAVPKPPPLPRGLVSFRDGLETLPRALAASLGRAFRPSTAASRVAPEGARWKVETPQGAIFADRVILASPAWRASGLVRSFAPEAAAALDAIPHPPLAVLHLSWPESALLRPLRGFGHLVAPDPSRRILGAVWSSSLFAGRAPAGHSLITVFLGGTRDPGAFELSDDALAAAAAKDLQAEGIARTPPRVVRTTRWERAIPQYERGHEERIRTLAAAESRWPGLTFLGNYRGGISVGDVVRSALATATPRADAPPRE
jgi:oxygen-dependent protoporphyrinogen oxidase